MKLFQIIQTNLTSLGVGPTQLPLNKFQLDVIANLLTLIILLCIYLIHVANTPKEYMNAMYLIYSAMCCLIGFASLTLQTDTLGLFIGNFEQMFEKRKLEMLKQICLFIIVTT